MPFRYTEGYVLLFTAFLCSSFPNATFLRHRHSHAALQIAFLRPSAAFLFCWTSAVCTGNPPAGSRCRIILFPTVARQKRLFFFPVNLSKLSMHPAFLRIRNRIGNLSCALLNPPCKRPRKRHHCHRAQKSVPLIALDTKKRLKTNPCRNNQHTHDKLDDGNAFYDV